MECLNLMSRWKRKQIFGLLVLMIGSCYGIQFEVMTPTAALDNGRRRMEELSQRSNLPTEEATCWKSALENLHVGCKMMTEDNQIRMALRFTSCFNEMLGITPYICEPKTPAKECLKKLDLSAQSTFREYFLHTQDMCYFLRQETWQEQTNSAVNRLTDAATDVTLQMFEQKLIQEQIYSTQQESLMVQSNMKKDNEDLYNAVVRVKDVFDDFSETAKEHQLISGEIFDKLSRMQKLVSWIQGEMSLLDMIFFYFGAIVFGYFATTTARTRAARFWLIILFMVSVWSEKVLYKYLTQSDFGYNITPEDVQAFIWMVRKIAAAAGTLIVLIAAATYRDIQIVNNNMLISMNFTLEKIAQFIKDQSGGAKLDANGEMQQLLTKKQAEGGDDDSDADTYSNYSSDESVDNLEHELKALSEEDENTENVEPGGFAAVGRYFKSSPKDSPLSPMRHRYNLRERSATPRENPVVNQESVTDFARLIKKKKTPSKPAQSSLNYFSSDDDEQ